MKKLFLLLLFCLIALDAKAGLREDPVASLPSVPVLNTTRIVTDGITEADCTVGGGDKIVLCTFTAGGWTPGGGGGATVSTGTTLPATCTPGGDNGLFLDTDDETLHACVATDTFILVNTTEADTLNTVFTRGKSITGASSFANAVKFLDTNGDGTAFYSDPTDGVKIVCVDNNVENACTNYTRALASGQSVIYENSSATQIFTLTESTGALTNVTLNGESTGNTLTLTEEHWFDVVACQESTAQHIWNTITATFPAAACDTGSNTQKGYASFDATADEAIQMDWVLPTGFTGAIDIHFIWKAAATSGATGWCAQLIRVADASTSDPAFPAQAAGNCVSDTAKGTTLQENHATISGVTCTSCAARDHVYVRISRNGDGGGSVTDDMTGDAHLMKVGRTWRVAH